MVYIYIYGPFAQLFVIYSFSGVRFVKPYWGAYKTYAKGRWVDHKLVDVFKREFLGADPNYMVSLASFYRIYRVIIIFCLLFVVTDSRREARSIYSQRKES